MTSSTFVLLSGSLSFGVPLLFAVRELLLLTRPRGGGEEPPPEERCVTPPKPLPACLLPQPTPAREPLRHRILEDA